MISTTCGRNNTPKVTDYCLFLLVCFAAESPCSTSEITASFGTCTNSTCRGRCANTTGSGEHVLKVCCIGQENLEDDETRKSTFTPSVITHSIKKCSKKVFFFFFFFLVGGGGETSCEVARKNIIVEYE